MATRKILALAASQPFAEAHALYRMIDDENTVEELRELIAVPARIEWALRAYGQAHPEEAHFIDKSLMFRQAVGREFERLVCGGVPMADLPEIEEVELDAWISEVAFAGR